jgi:hypothetical protein
MTAKITQTDDQKRVLDAEQAPVFFVDAAGKTTHVVLPIGDARRMFDDYLRRELQIGFDEADRGELVDWDPDRIKAQGRELLRQQREGA